MSLGLELHAAEAKVPAELGDLQRVLSHLETGLEDVLDDLRELSRGLHPAVLSEGVQQLFVNGVAAVDNGRMTGALSGRPLPHTPTAGTCK